MQAGAGEGVAAGGFHLNLLSTQLHACQLSVCVCESVCVRPFGPKPCQVFGQSVCQSAISMAPPPIVNRQRQSMRQSVRQLVTYSMRCCCIDSLDLCAAFYALLLNALRPQRRQRFLLLASIKIQIQHACQGNKPTIIYTQASWPRPPQVAGTPSLPLPGLPAGGKTHQAKPTIKLRNFSIYA